MYAYFDSGTTYSRIFLVDEKNIVDVEKKAIGSKDTSVAQENLILVEELREMYDRLLQRQHLKDRDIQEIYASGMVTSPFGIKEVPHVSLPVSFEELRRQIVSYFEPHYFKRTIHLIPGVKNIGPDSVVVKQNFCDVNSTRGEEFEAFGIISNLRRNVKAETAVLILPGSHTQMLYIKNEKICDVLSTMWGELFFAISQNTILSNSMIRGNYQVDEEMLLTGFSYLQEYGFSRAIYMVNTMQIFTDISNVRKTSYLEGIITGGVLQALQWQLKNKWLDVDRIIVGASPHITHIYELLLEEMKLGKQISKVVSDELRSFSVQTFLKLIEMEARE